MSVSQERQPASERIAAEHIAGFRDLFINRSDVFAVQTKTGYFAKRETLTDLHVWQHLEGDITLGVYALSEEGECRWVNSFPILRKPCRNQPIHCAKGHPCHRRGEPQNTPSHIRLFPGSGDWEEGKSSLESLRGVRVPVA